MTIKRSKDCTDYCPKSCKYFAIRFCGVTPTSARCYMSGGRKPKSFPSLHWRWESTVAHTFLEDSCPLTTIIGTLSSALQQIRSYSSALRKGYLTTDIILGLEALHRCGYCHGDVKTDNIIIQSHPHREFIAKLADFSGVKSVVTRHDESRPDFGTPTWQPPEVIMHDPDIDWQSADIYSLGMVIATIWTTEGFIPQGGTFLDTQLTYELDTTSKSLWTNTKKTKDDMNPESMISSAFKATAYTESLPSFVKTLISYTLPRCPGNRATAKDISHRVATPFLMQLGNR